MTEPLENVRRYEHRAMATLFEILIASEEDAFASGAAREAFAEIDRIEEELSRFIPSSDVSRINGLPPDGAIRVGLHTFECLRESLMYRDESGGAFDITLGPLVDCWIARDGSIESPSPDRIARAKERTGMERLRLDEPSMTVGTSGSAPGIDLGAVGKGYAVDCAASLLREWGCSSALVHGGRSSAFAFGDHPGCTGWPVTLTHPARPSQRIEKIYLENRGLGGSGITRRKHIIDPRSGLPVEATRAAWVLSTSAARSDALSTACMVMTEEEIRTMADRAGGFRAIIVDAGTDRVSVIDSRVPAS